MTLPKFKPVLFVVCGLLLSAWMISVVKAQAAMPIPSAVMGQTPTLAPQYPSVVFKAVLLPTDQTSYCSAPANTSMCGFLNDLVAASAPGATTTNQTIYALFQKWKVVVYDLNGNNVSPYKP